VSVLAETPPTLSPQAGRGGSGGGGPSDPVYVYLCYGRSPAAERELRYALETLRAETPGDVAIYADRPEAFADLDVTLVDAGALVAQARAHPYLHRLKPMVLADALRRFGRPCVLLDLDSFVRPGFARRVAQALEDGAAMNLFVRRDPYPFFPPFETDLPNLGRYRLDRAKALMLNSGLVAARAEHLPLIEDALALIDRLWDGGLHKHDVEQFAIAETLRLGGVKIALIDDVFVHYCPRWARRFMRRALRRRAPGARIRLSKTRVRLFKAAWTLRLAMRKARHWRGLSWRKT
jgi:hypothetical protein